MTRVSEYRNPYVGEDFSILAPGGGGELFLGAKNNDSGIRTSKSGTGGGILSSVTRVVAGNCFRR